MKRLLIIICILFAAIPLSAQNPFHHGFAFGVDRDTLLYLIASPFDNWYISVGAKGQTYIGNEQDSRARWNPATFGVGAEVGKWLIPDVAVAIRLSLFDVKSQGCYVGRNPWLDKTQTPLVTPFVAGHNAAYYPMDVDGVSVMGVFVFDWTNFLSGYEAGKRKRLHFFTPLGLGGMALFGKQINSTAEAEYAGKMRLNKELAFTGGIAVEYITTRHLSLNVAFDMVGTRGTIDWTYSQDYPDAPHPRRIVDWVPSLTFSLKFNLLKSVNKFNPYSHVASREPVNHEFLTVGSRHQLDGLHARVALLNNKLDSLENQNRVDTVLLAQYKDSLDHLQYQLDRLPEPPAINVMEALIEKDMALTVIYFDLDKYNVENTARYQLRTFAKMMEKAPDTIEYYLIGAADSLTGSKRHNDWLSEKRSRAAYDVLVNDYGANANQLIPVPVGGITVYEEKEENRMVMIVIRNKEADEIIAKWSRYKK